MCVKLHFDMFLSTMPSAPNMEILMTNDLFLIEQQFMDSGRKESFRNENEKHISIDPISLKGATLKPPKLKLVNSCSLSSSASSSPRLPKSKSVGEGRSSAPADDFVLVLENSKPSEKDVPDDGVKCSKLCMFLPRGKGKPVRSASSPSISSRSHKTESTEMISRTVSLERFDCDSSANDGDDKNLFLDLPLELIRCSISDMQSPVKAAFVFDKEPKGVLKNYSSGSLKLKSQDSIKQVRFSTSSPTTYPPSSSSSCVTPRLRKARDDFNAFLEAQTS